MDPPSTERVRIIVIARPTLGRVVSDRLEAVGYEVYRTPDASNLSALRSRVRPDLAIVSLDLLDHDGLAAALQIRAEARGIPVLLLGDVNLRQRANGLPCVSATADAAALLAAVAGALDGRTGMIVWSRAT